MRVFNEEKNNQLVKDGVVLSQKNKLYLASLSCLIFYIFIGSYLVPRINGKNMIKNLLLMLLSIKLIAIGLDTF